MAAKWVDGRRLGQRCFRVWNDLSPFVWEEGGAMLDLNTRIPEDSGLQLTNAININDREEILAKSVPVGVTPIDDEDLGHLLLLIQCRAVKAAKPFFFRK
jgi:hypothetical protein